MPTTTSAAAALSDQQNPLIQLLLAQQNALLLKQQSQMMTNTTISTSSNRSGLPPGFGTVSQTLPATEQSSAAAFLLLLQLAHQLHSAIADASSTEERPLIKRYTSFYVTTYY